MNILRQSNCRIYQVIMLVLASAMAGARMAPAAMFYNVDKTGHVVSATADFSAAGDILTVKISNTTPVTLGVQDLLKSIDFSLSGLTPTLISVTGTLRTIAVDGTFSDGTAAQNMSWSLKSADGDTWQLDATPNAEHAIVGPPTGGSYDGVSRSIRGNPGHNPFSAEMVIVELNVPGLPSAAQQPVMVTGFGFSSDAVGTITPSGPLEIPEPSTWNILILSLVGMTFGRPVCPSRYNTPRLS